MSMNVHQHLKAILSGFLLCGTLLFTSTTLAQSKVVQKADKYLMEGDTAKALKVLNKRITKHPKEADPYMKRAEIKIARQDYDPANVDLNSYISLSDDVVGASYRRDIIRYRQNDFHSATAHFSKYLSENEDDAQAWTYLGLSHLATKNYEVASNAFFRAIQLNPNDALANYNAGLAAYHAASYEAADLFLRKAITLSPNDVNALLLRALCRSKMNDLVESNNVLREALEIDPENGAVLYNLGVNYYNLDETQVACDYWQKAVDVNNPSAKLAITSYCPEQPAPAQGK